MNLNSVAQAAQQGVSYECLIRTLVEQDVESGLKIAAKTQAEEKRRLSSATVAEMGLGFSLGAILIVFVGMGLHIRLGLIFWADSRAAFCRKSPKTPPAE